MVEDEGGDDENDEGEKGDEEEHPTITDATISISIPISIPIPIPVVIGIHLCLEMIGLRMVIVVEGFQGEGLVGARPERGCADVEIDGHLSRLRRSEGVVGMEDHGVASSGVVVVGSKGRKVGGGDAGGESLSVVVGGSVQGDEDGTGVLLDVGNELWRGFEREDGSNAVARVDGLVPFMNVVGGRG